MDMNPINCPSCDSIILLRYGSMPLGSAESGDKFEATCPICEVDFEIGYLTDFRKVEHKVGPVEDLPQSETPEDEAPVFASGGGSHSLSSSDISSTNDQHSNPMNPNSASFKAAGDNRSNQMNPNNSAYRTSRGT